MKRFFLGTYFFIIVAIAVTIVGVGFLVDFYIAHRYPGVLARDDQNLSRGTFYLIEQELVKVPKEQYRDVVSNLQPRFGYPVEVKEVQSLQLTDEEKTALAKNDIVILEEGDFHLKRIGKSDYALTMGPFQYLQFKPMEITGFFVASASVLGLVVLGWTLYFWGRLKKIGEAALAFGQGEFTTRVVVPRFSSLSSIASTFNSMGDQIERLIFSHKQLVNAVSHELRTPISRIRFGLESLRTAEKEERTKQLSGIRHDVDELDDLVSELLSYAKFERMESQISLQNLPLLPWLREYMQVAKEISNVSIEFAWQDISEDYLVCFDPRQLERALHNLLQNGSRFARQLIQVKIVKEAGWIIITVEDDGPGIIEPDRQRVFDPFVRLDSSRNRENGGYGLGLSIVREIVRGHHGAITVDKSVLGGAAFCLKLPLNKALPQT